MTGKNTCHKLTMISLLIRVGDQNARKLLLRPAKELFIYSGAVRWANSFMITVKEI